MPGSVILSRSPSLRSRVNSAEAKNLPVAVRLGTTRRDSSLAPTPPHPTCSLRMTSAAVVVGDGNGKTVGKGSPSYSQVGFLNFLVGYQRLGFPAQGYPARFHHVADPCQGQGQPGVLLRQEDSRPLAVDFRDDPADVPDYHGGESQGRLVEEEELRLGHQCPADSQHLLLAPAQATRPQPRPLIQGGEK